MKTKLKRLIGSIAAAAMIAACTAVSVSASAVGTTYNSNANFPELTTEGWTTDHTWDNVWEAEIYDSTDDAYYQTYYHYKGGFANGQYWSSSIVKGDKFAVEQEEQNALTKHPVRTFNAPVAGELTIDAATITHYFNSGLTFNIKKNTETLWTASVQDYGTTAQPMLTINVNAGDKIRFEVIQTRKGTYCYEIGWTNDLEYTSLLSDYVQKTEYTCENGTVSFSYEKSPKADAADIYAAVYDSSERLVYCSVNTESGRYNGDASEDYTLKLFAWDKNVSMKPLCEPIVLKQYNYNPSPVTVSADMKANFLGDSITQGAGTSKAYLYYLADKLNVSHDNFRNYGISGTELARDNQYGESFIKRAANMNNDADIVFCLGGTNDFAENAGYVDLGSTDDLYLAPSFCGGFNRLCRVLLEKYPDKQIIILTPVKRQYTGTTSGGFTLEQFVNAEIEIANRYGIPVIDMYHPEELNFETLGWDEYAPDGLHPNDNGHKLMADYIYDQIINMGIIDQEYDYTIFKVFKE